MSVSDIKSVKLYGGGGCGDEALDASFIGGAGDEQSAQGNGSIQVNKVGQQASDSGYETGTETGTGTQTGTETQTESGSESDSDSNSDSESESESESDSDDGDVEVEGEEVDGVSDEEESEGDEGGEVEADEGDAQEGAEGEEPGGEDVGAEAEGEGEEDPDVVSDQEGGDAVSDKGTSVLTTDILSADTCFFAMSQLLMSSQNEDKSLSRINIADILLRMVESINRLNNNVAAAIDRMPLPLRLSSVSNTKPAAVQLPIPMPMPLPPPLQQPRNQIQAPRQPQTQVQGFPPAPLAAGPMNGLTTLGMQKVRSDSGHPV